MYEELVLGRIDLVTITNPLGGKVARRFPEGVPFVFEQGEPRWDKTPSFEFARTLAENLTLGEVKRRCQGKNAQLKHTALRTKHDGIQVFFGFHGYGPEKHADELCLLLHETFVASEPHRRAISAMQQLPMITSLSFVLPANLPWQLIGRDAASDEEARGAHQSTLNLFFICITVSLWIHLGRFVTLMT